MDMRMGAKRMDVWKWEDGPKMHMLYCMYSCVREGGGVGTVFGSSPVLPHTV
ncbi:hypothetical protein HanOQP8_Chr15g0594121 [Helianthus annuus]|nr:hypothetical protein HanOQP8_Chr15g0594121 [Helianthus annuus]